MYKEDQDMGCFQSKFLLTIGLQKNICAVAANCRQTPTNICKKYHNFQTDTGEKSRLDDPTKELHSSDLHHIE